MKIANINALTHVQNIQKYNTTAQSVSFGCDECDSFTPSTKFEESIKSDAGLFSKSFQWTGMVNDQPVDLEQNNTRRFFNNSSQIDGWLGEKPVELIRLKDQGVVLYSGRIGEQEVIVKIDKPGSYVQTLEGSVGKEKVIVKPGFDANLDENSSDIVTLIFALEGKKINTENGMFTHLSAAHQAVEEGRVLAEMSQIEQRYGNRYRHF